MIKERGDYRRGFRLLQMTGTRAGSPRSRASWAGGLLLGAMLLSACAQVRLREAMNEVQEKYVVLMDEFEAGSNFGARDAARELRKALEAPEVAKRPPQDPEFQRLLVKAVETTRLVEREAQRFDGEALAKLRSEVSSRCQSCHERFRAPTPSN